MMISMSNKWLASLAAAFFAFGFAAPVSAKPLKQISPGHTIYKPGPSKKIVQPLPGNKHVKSHRGRNVAIGIAAVTAAAIAAGASGNNCRRWERQCDDGSRRACRKYDEYCD